MKKKLTDQIVSKFIEELSDMNLFSDEEIQSIQILANRDELANKSKVESFLNSATSIVPDKIDEEE